MLGDHNVAATLPVADLARAREFYEGTLGLKPELEMEPEAVLYASGQSRVLVYRSEYSGTNQGTAASWVAADGFDQEVAALREQGVRFERYDLPGTTLEGDVHVMGEAGLRSVWFKDPDGNILNLSNQ
jgi:catechol 2,3-dioxygenase-like lactoylglutathione lyase family enzyme